jgi:hypothetical protein
MSERFQRTEAAFANPKTLFGAICIVCICATVGFVAYLAVGNNQPPRKLWSPVVIEANGNQTVLGETRQLEFWTPSIETKDYLAKPGAEIAPTDQWQVISNNDTILAFGTLLHSNTSVLGYRRVEVWGHGSTGFKPGWWWTLNVLTNYTAGDLGQAYQDFWKSRHPVFIEVIDNRGRDE